MARPPLPAKIKEGRGNAGKREIRPNVQAPAIAPEPAVVVSAAPQPPAVPASQSAAGIQPPAWVAARLAAAEQWKSLAPEMIQRQTLTVWDVNRFGRYCVLMACWLENLKALERFGLLQDGKSGPTKSAALIAALDIDKELRPLEEQFGFSPVSRSKLFAPESAGDPARAAQEVKFFGEQEEA